jgi:hypothetical protein
MRKLQLLFTLSFLGLLLICKSSMHASAECQAGSVTLSLSVPTRVNGRGYIDEEIHHVPAISSGTAGSNWHLECVDCQK